MAALNIDPDGWRRTGELVELAGHLLGADFDAAAACPSCGGDQASQTIMSNLNARHDWLISHVRAGGQQAAAAASAMADTAASYQSEDAAAASRYGQFGTSAGAPAAAPASTAGSSHRAAAPAAMPSAAAIPDVSGTEGEALATQLETGAGPGPATATAARLTALAARAQAANASLTSAHAQLLAAGQSAATPGAAGKLTRAIAWTEAVAGQASALAAGYDTAAALHASTLAEVGPSASWRTLKNGYNEAVIKNQLTAGLAQPEVDAWQAALVEQDQRKAAGMSGLQAGGEAVSTPPGDLLDPQLAPEGTGVEEASDDGDHDDVDDEDTADLDDGASGMQDLLGPLMGVAGPAAQAAGKANPLSSLGQAAQQFAQQAGQLGSTAAKKAASPLKPAALAKPGARASKGGGGAGKGGGSSPIKPASGLRGAALGGAPAATPPSTASGGEAGKSSPAAGASSGRGAGMGMMPMMGRGGAGGSKAAKVNSYEAPLPEVDEAGRPGVVGQGPATAEPVVDPESRNAVKARLARRKKDTATTADG